MRTNTRHYALSDLLSDAENIATLSPQEQEQTIAALRQEVEAAKAKILAMDASGTQPTPAQVAHTQTMMTALSGARQCCPTCRSAQAPMPMMPPSACGAAPMMPMPPMMQQPQTMMTMNAMQPFYGGLPQGGMYDRLADDTRLLNGARGADVLRLQQLLRTAGYSVATDGIFGDKTEKALIKFQQARGLRGDGIYKEVDAVALQKAAGEKSGATARAEAGKNDVPTTREKVVPIVETGLRVGVPLVAGGVAGFASWKGIKESNVQKKGAYSAAIGVGTALVTYIGVNFLADSLVTIQEQPL